MVFVNPKQANSLGVLVSYQKYHRSKKFVFVRIVDVVRRVVSHIN